MTYLYCIALGYLIGTINPAYLIGKWRGLDIRSRGSGNAGASNALILFGKLLGVLCALFDIAKAYAAIALAQHLFPDFSHAFVVTGVCVILGHIFPFYMGFKGGKGLAALGGMVLRYDWVVFLIMLVCEAVLALVVDYICIVPITASIVFPILYGVMTGDILGALILGIATLVILGKHAENIKRIKTGTEMHLSYLWKPKEEMKRMKENLGKPEDEIDAHFSGEGM